MRFVQRRSAHILFILLLTYAYWSFISLGTHGISTIPGFDTTLHDLLELLPTDQYADHLLSPINHSSGEAMLLDLATRTRVYAQMFTMWQHVHLPRSEARSNIVTLIRQTLPHGTNELIDKYDRMRCFFNRFSQHLFPWTTAYFADHSLLHASFRSAGRGIVMTVGNRQVPYAWTSITVLRELRCTLPVEIFYLGDDDLNPTAQDALTKLPGVATRDLSWMVYDDTWTLKGWAAKPMALLLSSFREVILLDADVLFLANPANLFEEPDYIQHGALFFRDRLLSPVSRKDFLERSLPPPISPLIQKSNRWWIGTSGHMQESGVVVVDKWYHFVALLLTTRLNGPERDGKPGEVGVYQMMHGDKETFWLSWEMSGDFAYAFYEGGAGQIGHFVRDESKGSGEICGLQLLHLSHQGRPLWFNGWISENKNHDDHMTNFVDFRGFIAEPFELTVSGDPWDAWEERDGGTVMCLHAKTSVPLSEGERDIIDTIVATAQAWSDLAFDN